MPNFEKNLLLSPAAQDRPLPYIWGVARDVFRHTKLDTLLDLQNFVLIQVGMLLILRQRYNLYWDQLIQHDNFNNLTEGLRGLKFGRQPLRYVPCCHGPQHTLDQIIFLITRSSSLCFSSVLLVWLSRRERRQLTHYRYQTTKCCLLSTARTQRPLSTDTRYCNVV